jgi:HlyD family secretion protein
MPRVLPRMSSPRPPLDGLRIDRSRAARPRLPVGLLVGVMVVLLLTALVVAWLLRPRPVMIRSVAVREVATSPAATTLLNASGYVTARREATVSSKVTGKIVEVLVEEGRRVEAGDVLARVDPSNTEASLRLAEAQLHSIREALAETEANLSLAELNLRRQTELAASATISQSELDRAEAEARALRGRRGRSLADVTVAERQVEVWRQQLDDTIIRAPFAGVVTSKNAQPGEMISPMSAGGFTRTGVCTLVDMSSLEIEVDVNESFINRVEPGQPVQATLDAYPDWRIPARVIAIIPTADRQKATVRVRVGFEQLDPRILPDMGVKVAFQSAPGGEPTATRHVVVPRSALRQRQGRDIVWVVQEGRAAPRAVAVASQQGEEVVIASGVAAGERVMVEGPVDLNEGARIEELKS